VELSERTIDILDTAEVEALIAHEFAHHICGHCRKHNLLQVLGRLTLVGDGFVGTLEDSFGNELEADRTAVTRLCIKPEVLRECLAKMHVDAVLQHSRASESVGGLALHAVGAQEPPAWALTVAAPSGLVASLKRRCAAWLMLYTSEAEIAYWHPATDERIAALR
jgi:Zn-dependent protease with chaperone function